MNNKDKTSEKVHSEPLQQTDVRRSALAENASYKVGDLHDNREIKTVYELKLYINHLGVISWYLYGSNQPHRTKWMNGEVKEIHDYHFCATAYYSDIKFSDWGKYTHKTLQYKIAENCGFESPRAFADYLIGKYKIGFKGQLVSFRNIEY
jgi:hypothetical protein